MHQKRVYSTAKLSCECWCSSSGNRHEKWLHSLVSRLSTTFTFFSVIWAFSTKHHLVSNSSGSSSCNAGVSRGVSRHQTANKQLHHRERQEIGATVPAEDRKCDGCGSCISGTDRQLQPRMALLRSIHQSLHNHSRSGLGCHFAFRRSSRNNPPFHC